MAAHKPKPKCAGEERAGEQAPSAAGPLMAVPAPRTRRSCRERPPTPPSRRRARRGSPSRDRSPRRCPPTAASRTPRLVVANLDADQLLISTDGQADLALPMPKRVGDDLARHQHRGVQAFRPRPGVAARAGDDPASCGRKAATVEVKVLHPLLLPTHRTVGPACGTHRDRCVASTHRSVRRVEKICSVRARCPRQHPLIRIADDSATARTGP